MWALRGWLDDDDDEVFIIEVICQDKIFFYINVSYFIYIPTYTYIAETYS